jgi:RNA polymerase sigma-70 factor (ECF subfamily)
MFEGPADAAAEPMGREAEKRLVLRAQRGSADAFRELVDGYKDRLFAFIWRMIRNHHEAEDICQGAFVRAYESLESYSEEYAFSTWLYTIAYRLCLNHLRKKKAYSGEVDFAQFGGEDEDAAISVANSEDARRLGDLVWSAVDELTPAQRAAVLLFYRDGKNCNEIGQAMSVPAVTVKSHLHRAREKLRAILGKVVGEEWLGAERRNSASRAGFEKLS